MDIEVEPQPFDVEQYRTRMAHKARSDTPTKPDAVWAAKELVYWCTCTDPRNAYFVVLRLPLGVEAAASSPSGGERVVRLLYEWSEIEPHLHLTCAQLSNTILSKLASEGNILRAGLAYAAKHHRG